MWSSSSSDQSWIFGQVKSWYQLEQHWVSRHVEFLIFWPKLNLWAGKIVVSSRAALSFTSCGVPLTQSWLFGQVRSLYQVELHWVSNHLNFFFTPKMTLWPGADIAPVPLFLLPRPCITWYPSYQMLIFGLMFLLPKITLWPSTDIAPLPLLLLSRLCSIQSEGGNWAGSTHDPPDPEGDAQWWGRLCMVAEWSWAGENRWVPLYHSLPNGSDLVILLPITTCLMVKMIVISSYMRLSWAEQVGTSNHFLPPHMDWLVPLFTWEWDEESRWVLLSFAACCDRFWLVYLATLGWRKQ
jgi:hypothetical protein